MPKRAPSVTPMSTPRTPARSPGEICPAYFTTGRASSVRDMLCALDGDMEFLRGHLGGHKAHPIDTMALGMWRSVRDWALAIVEAPGRGQMGVKRGAGGVKGGVLKKPARRRGR